LPNNGYTGIRQFGGFLAFTNFSKIYNGWIGSWEFKALRSIPEDAGLNEK